MIIPYQRYAYTVNGVYHCMPQRGTQFELHLKDVVRVIIVEKDHLYFNIWDPSIQDFSSPKKMSIEQFMDFFEKIEDYPKFKNQSEMFNWIWNDRIHKSQLTPDQDLLPEGHFKWHWQFLHVLPKGSYPKWKLNPENILLATPDEHDHQEHYPYFNELRQQYTLEYHQLYYK